jgi:hypothetical protein
MTDKYRALCREYWTGNCPARIAPAYVRVMRVPAPVPARAYACEARVCEREILEGF